MLGQMEIRKKIVDPRKATSINDYQAAVTEREHNIDELIKIDKFKSNHQEGQKKKARQTKKKGRQ